MTSISMSLNFLALRLQDPSSFAGASWVEVFCDVFGYVSIVSQNG